jgi:hypothetical protein
MSCESRSSVGAGRQRIPANADWDTAVGRGRVVSLTGPIVPDRSTIGETVGTVDGDVPVKGVVDWHYSAAWQPLITV